MSSGKANSFIGRHKGCVLDHDIPLKDIPDITFRVPLMMEQEDQCKQFIPCILCSSTRILVGVWCPVSLLLGVGHKGIALIICRGPHPKSRARGHPHPCWWGMTKLPHLQVRYTHTCTANGFEKGFRIGYSAEAPELRPSRFNMISATEHPQVVAEYIVKELSSQHLIELNPTDDVLSNTHISLLVGKATPTAGA